MWQKESKHKNAFYVNICGSGMKVDEIYKNVRAEINAHKKMTELYSKSDYTAVKKRKYGKLLFNVREWQEAIDLFNESLCFAEKGSQNIGIAYANRSACFFNLKMFDKCLIDIDLAIENNYPKHLVWQLEKRKQICLQYCANETPAQEYTLTLDFGANERFMGLSSAVKIQKDADNLPSVVASQNIDVGQIVGIDEAFTKTSYTIYGWKCNICLRSSPNLVPCKKCTTAMFCSECVDNNLHKYECGMKTSLYSEYNNNLMQELRTFFVAMDLFATADEMMEFVEQTLATDPCEIPKSLSDQRSRYRSFLKLPKNGIVCLDEHVHSVIFCVYKILLEIPKVQTMFESKKHRRFLMHLVGHHIEINYFQAYLECKRFEIEDGTLIQRQLYSQTGILLRYFKYSCCPNVVPIDVDGSTVYQVIRPVRIGEQLRVSFYNFLWENEHDSKRKVLAGKCDCERCSNQHPSKEEQQQFRMDPDFWCIESYQYQPNFDSVEYEDLQFIKEKCTRLLEKYGRMKWCRQFGLVQMVYTKILKTELNQTYQTQSQLQLSDRLNNNF